MKPFKAERRQQECLLLIYAIRNSSSFLFPTHALTWLTIGRKALRLRPDKSSKRDFSTGKWALISLIFLRSNKKYEQEWRGEEGGSAIILEVRGRYAYPAVMLLSQRWLCPIHSAQPQFEDPAASGEVMPEFCLPWDWDTQLHTQNITWTPRSFTLFL